MAAGDIKPVLALGGLAFVAYALGGGQGQSARGRRTHLVVGEKVKYSREGLWSRPERGHLRGLIRKVHPDGYTVDWTYYDEIITTREKDMALVSAASKTLWWPGDHYEGKTPPGHSARGRRLGRFPRAWAEKDRDAKKYFVAVKLGEFGATDVATGPRFANRAAAVSAAKKIQQELEGGSSLASVRRAYGYGHSARGRRSIRLETRVAANCHVEGSKPGWKTTGYGFTQDSPSGKWQSRGSMQAFVELWHPNTSRMMDFPVTRSWLKRHPPGTPCKDFRAPKGRSARGRRAPAMTAAAARKYLLQSGWRKKDIDNPKPISRFIDPSLAERYRAMGLESSLPVYRVPKRSLAKTERAWFALAAAAREQR